MYRQHNDSSTFEVQDRRSTLLSAPEHKNRRFVWRLIAEGWTGVRGGHDVTYNWNALAAILQNVVRKVHLDPWRLPGILRMHSVCVI